MNRKILVVCDPEQEYAERLAEYLGQRQGFPFEVHIFREMDRLLAFAGQSAEEIELLLVAESAYCKELEELSGIHIMILNESGKVTYPAYQNVDKYQTAENIVREVMGYCAEHLAGQTGGAFLRTGTKLIGLYTPVGRCLQTGFALTLGQLLARKGRVLYLNLEGYSGFSRMRLLEGGTGLAELIYYAQNVQTRLIYKVESAVRKFGELEYVPPFFSMEDLNAVSGKEWKELLEQLSEKCRYDYILLDLSDHIRGLFEVLKMCTSVYTLVEDQKTAQAKLAEYEEDLKECGYGAVWEKTKQLRLPWMEQLPQDFSLLTVSALADYIRRELKNDGYGAL